MAEINNRYIGILLRQKKYPNAIDVAATCIRNNKSDEQTTAYFKQAFMATGKAEEEFVEEMKKIDNASKEKLRGEIRKAMTDEPAPDFELRSLEGKIVKLSTLKGKIVVVDFWATWCNPCRMSFPFLQKVYEKYQNDPRIAILALNTWEREKGEAREKTVRKFIDENKYTFPVLFDETTVQKYGVDGIPTKFILDGNGRIRYKEVGFNGGPDMVNKMDLVFEMLLAEMK
jgi:thiol-disulfide isomerase/thioredoxin